MSVAAPDDAVAAGRARSQEARLLGLAIGVAVGPAGGFVQGWSGNADGRWHVWLLMAAVGALVGAASLPVFLPPASGPRGASVVRALGLGWLALFGFVVALVAGTFAAFPVGASMGAVGGAAGGLVAGLVWRVERLVGTRWRWPLAAGAATLLAFFVMAWWTA